MADEQRCVDEIRFHLQASYCELTDELRQLAAQYAASCHEANQRLQRCSDYLRQGLRSEAINVAEAEPNLLDLVATLDFTERDQWEEIVEQYELPRIEPLLLDVATSLNEAYAAEQPLADLLKLHRRLVLQGAPLDRRLKVMRRLCELDEESTFWEDDIRQFEQARFLEIEQQAREAVRDSDSGRLKELAAELTSLDWLEEPPAALRQRLRKAAGSAGRRHALQELKPLAEQLDEALATLNFEQGRELATRWYELATTAGLEEGSELYERAAPALGWVEDELAREAEENEWQLAVAQLEQALDNQRTPLADLDQLEIRLQRLDRPIPELLDRRLTNRVQLLKTAERRRQLLVGVAVVAVVLLAGGFAGTMGYRQLQAREVQRLAAAVEQLLEEGQLGEARNLFDENAGISTSPAWIDLRARLASAESVEQDRQSRLESLLKGAASTTDYLKAVAQLEQAAEIARAGDEQSRVLELRRLRQEQHEQDVRERNERFRASLADARDRLRNIETAIAANTAMFNAVVGDSIEADITELEQLLARLAVDAKQSHKDLVKQVELLDRQLKSLKKSRQAAQTHRELITRLTDGAWLDDIAQTGDDPLAEYRESLQEYIKQFPGNSGTADLKKSAAEFPLWEGELAGAALLAGWRNREPADLEELRLRLDQCDSYLRQHSRAPLAATVQEYAKWLRTARLREEDADGDRDEGLKRRLESLFDSRLMTDLHVLETKDNRVFYLTEEQDFTGAKSAAIKFVTGFSLETRGTNLVADDLKQAMSRPAPQAVLAKSVLEQLPVVSFSRWNDYLLTLATRIQADNAMDPLLRYLLLRRTLELAARGDVYLKQELESVLNLLDDDNIDLTTRWIDPTNEEAGPFRQQALKVLKKVPELMPIWQRADDRETQLLQALRSEWRLIGWLDRDSEDGWFFRSNWQPEGEYDLRVIYPASESAPALWRRVGRVQDGALKLLSTAGPGLQQGRLVSAFPTGPVKQPGLGRNTAAAGQRSSK